MVACFPSGVTSCLGLPGTEVFPRMQDFQCLNLGRSWENQNDWSPYLANTPKLICRHQSQLLDPFLRPCSAKCQSFSWWLLSTTFDLWQSPESPGTKVTLGSIYVLEMSLLRHTLSLRPQWSLCLQYHFFQKHGTFSHVYLLFSHIVTQNKGLIFMLKASAILSSYPLHGLYFLISSPRYINSIDARSETDSQSPFLRQPSQNPSWSLLMYLLSLFPRNIT